MMKRPLPTALAVVAMGTLVLAAVSSTTADTLRTEHRIVQMGAARSVDVHLRMGAGRLQVSGSAPKLMDAYFRYNRAAWRPEVRYAVRAGHGQLTVRQPSTNNVGNSTNIQDETNFQNDWNVRLHSHVPLGLSVEEGAGTSTLQLGSLSLTGLDVKLGAGETTLNLAGTWSHSFDATVQAGVGRLTIMLPGQVGARVTVQHGLGAIMDASIGAIEANGLRQDGDDTYVNSAYGSSPVTVNVSIEQGVGTIVLDQAS
jgi:N-terminal domain of toast_rack, DUF2154